LEIVDINKKLSVTTTDISGLKTEMIELRSEFNSKLDKMENSFDLKFEAFKSDIKNRYKRIKYVGKSTCNRNFCCSHGQFNNFLG
jgi:phage host-nuclease inhibitor protein Gam